MITLLICAAAVVLLMRAAGDYMLDAAGNDVLQVSGNDLMDLGTEDCTCDDCAACAATTHGETVAYCIRCTPTHYTVTFTGITPCFAGPVLNGTYTLPHGGSVAWLVAALDGDGVHHDNINLVFTDGATLQLTGDMFDYDGSHTGWFFNDYIDPDADPTTIRTFHCCDSFTLANTTAACGTPGVIGHGGMAVVTPC